MREIATKTHSRSIPAMPRGVVVLGLAALSWGFVIALWHGFVMVTGAV